MLADWLLEPKMNARAACALENAHKNRLAYAFDQKIIH